VIPAEMELTCSMVIAYLAVLTAINAMAINVLAARKDMVL